MAVSGASPSFTTITTTSDATLNGQTAGRGGGSVATNTAFGQSAMAATATGTENTALGREALTALTSGGQNTALGRSSLASNSTGSGNTGVGVGAGSSSTTTSYNTAVGSRSLEAATGTYNTAVGYQAGSSVTSATGYNTFVGGLAGPTGAGSTGYNNTAMGYQALTANTTGYYNTAIGAGAFPSVTTGAGNTAVGEGAGGTLATTNNCTFLGQRPVASASNVSHEIVIGCNTSGKGSNTAFINANSGATYNGGNTANWNTTSDQRLKKNIVDNTEGLNIISQIRVRNFEYRTAEEVTELPAHTVIDKQGVQLGVIAQELQEVCSDCVHEESTGVLSVQTDNLTWHMINAIKDLKAELDTVKAELAALKG
jgi:hypothetical protein